MKTTTKIAYEWAVRCFGTEHVHDMKVRSTRTAEEAIELAQACGVPRITMIDLVNIVYTRPRGDRDQEIGGVLLTVAVLCASLGGDPDEWLERELLRVLARPKKHFADRNQEKNQAGLS